MRTLVILPTYNEAEGIREVLLAIRSSVPDIHVLVVDDASPDGTAEIVEILGRTDRSISLMRRAGKQGLGSAYRDGFAWGIEQGFEICVEMDADLSHDPGDLPRLIGLIGQGCDLAIGSRYVEGGSIPEWSWWRRVLSRGGNIYSSVLLGLKVKDCTSGFRAYSSELLSSIDLAAIRSEGYAFQIEMTRAAKSAGARIVEAPISFADRTRGESKLSSAIVLEALSLVSVWGLGRLVTGLSSSPVVAPRSTSAPPGTPTGA